MEEIDYEGIEKREYFRILYSKMEKPVFRVGTDSFEILDISNRGIRFINDRNIRLTNYVTGELVFLSGETIRVEGILKWERSHMYGLYMKDQIPADTLARELQCLQDTDTPGA